MSEGMYVSDVVSGQGYQVDVEALMDAGLGAADVIDGVADSKIERADGEAPAFGHDGLAAELSGFCDKGAETAAYLTEDGMLLARVLIDSAGEYVTADEAGQAHLGDPAIAEASQGE